MLIFVGVSYLDIMTPLVLSFCHQNIAEANTAIPVHQDQLEW